MPQQEFEFPEDYQPFGGGGLPTIEKCDLTNPYQMFLWMFTAPPGVTGAPLITSTDFYQMMSKRLYDLGARLTCPNCGHHEEPMLKYVPPQWGSPNVWYDPGDWEPVE